MTILHITQHLADRSAEGNLPRDQQLQLPLEQVSGMSACVVNKRTQEVPLIKTDFQSL